MTPFSSPQDWPAVRAARAWDASARVPFDARDPLRPGSRLPLGAVARADLGALRRWPRWLEVSDRRVVLTARADEVADAFATMHAALRAEGLIRAWRDELFPLYSCDGTDQGVAIERAATRFWGTLTFGAHCNGYVTDERGAPARLWIARRSPTKATDPGKLDNLIGGGVPRHQSPHDTVVREGWEEAGLTPAQMAPLERGSVLRLLRDIPEGLQHEWIHVYDLALPAEAVPSNQDGEVAELALLDCADAVALACGDEMTVDAALVTLDFAWRRELFAPPTRAALTPHWQRWQQLPGSPAAA